MAKVEIVQETPEPPPVTIHIELSPDEAGMLRSLLNHTSGDTFTDLWRGLDLCGNSIPHYVWLRRGYSSIDVSGITKG